MRRHTRADLELDARARRELEVAVHPLMQDPLEVYDRFLHAVNDCKVGTVLQCSERPLPARRERLQGWDCVAVQLGSREAR